MLLQRLHGLFFVLLGLVSIADGWRITQQAREGANFDAIGPDRYLIALGGLLLAAGIWRTCQRAEPASIASGSARQEPRGEPDGAEARTLLLTVAALAGFALLVPIVGFTPASLLFLIAQLRIMADWPWWRIVLAALTIAAALDVTFVRFADMPLPKGSLWD
jgi:hypothetical protein